MKHPKPLSLLLFVTAFALLGLQQAHAQETSHEVTVDVAEVTTISDLGDLTFDLESLDTEVTKDASYDIVTNRSSRSVGISASESNEVDLTGLKLKVNVDGSASGTSEGPVELTNLGENDVSGGDLLTGFGQVDETVDLEYTAEADERFDPNETASFEITYTVTGDD